MPIGREQRPAPGPSAASGLGSSRPSGAASRFRPRPQTGFPSVTDAFSGSDGFGSARPADGCKSDQRRRKTRGQNGQMKSWRTARETAGRKMQRRRVGGEQAALARQTNADERASEEERRRKERKSRLAGGAGRTGRSRAGAVPEHLIGPLLLPLSHLTGRSQLPCSQQHVLQTVLPRLLSPSQRLSVDPRRRPNRTRWVFFNPQLQGIVSLLCTVARCHDDVGTWSSARPEARS